MSLFALLIGVIVLGMIVQAIVSKIQSGKVSLSRSWDLILGLALVLPTATASLAILRGANNPRPGIQTFSGPLILAFGLGICLLLRFVLTRSPRSTAQEV